MYSFKDSVVMSLQYCMVVDVTPVLLASVKKLEIEAVDEREVDNRQTR